MIFYSTVNSNFNPVLTKMAGVFDNFGISFVQFQAIMNILGINDIKRIDTMFRETAS